MMKRWIVLATLCVAASCTEQPTKATLSVHLFEAQLLADAEETYYAGWDTVSFGSTDAAVQYVVSPKPLLTEWNIAAFRASQPQADGTRAVTARLNAYAERAMNEFCSRPANLKKPLGLRVGDRWLNFNPLLKPVTDRLTLMGFTTEETEQLQRYIDQR